MRMPIISMTDAYPEGLTAEEFWSEQALFYQEMRQRYDQGDMTDTEDEIMTRLYVIESLRRAGEARIRRYNRLAADWNRTHGYN